MEFLVIMTTRVPPGTASAVVDDVRRREALRAAELASVNQLLRLWRPPLKPGEWRTFGLFAASDAQALERALASMPLRIWRTDEVTQLSGHPNDPGLSGISVGAAIGGAEFLIQMTVAAPAGTPSATIEDVRGREAVRAHELAAQGHLLRLWALPGSSGTWRALGLWRADDGDAIAALLDTLPLRQWMEVDITPLSVHPSDPAAGR